MSIPHALLRDFNPGPPASIQDVRHCEESAGVTFPKDFVEFLQLCNGGEGFVGSAYLILWRVEELSEMNRAYQVAKYAPGLFMFGSDGGGEAFAFDINATNTPIVSVPFVGMDRASAVLLAESFNDFLTQLASAPVQ